MIDPALIPERAPSTPRPCAVDGCEAAGTAALVLHGRRMPEIAGWTCGPHGAVAVWDLDRCVEPGCCFRAARWARCRAHQPTGAGLYGLGEPQLLRDPTATATAWRPNEECGAIGVIAMATTATTTTATETTMTTKALTLRARVLDILRAQPATGIRLCDLVALTDALQPTVSAVLRELADEGAAHTIGKAYTRAVRWHAGRAPVSLVASPPVEPANAEHRAAEASFPGGADVTHETPSAAGGSAGGVSAREPDGLMSTEAPAVQAARKPGSIVVERFGDGFDVWAPNWGLMGGGSPEQALASVRRNLEALAGRPLSLPAAPAPTAAPTAPVEERASTGQPGRRPWFVSITEYADEGTAVYDAVTEAEALALARVDFGEDDLTVEPVTAENVTKLQETIEKLSQRPDATPDDVAELIGVLGWKTVPGAIREARLLKAWRDRQRADGRDHVYLDDAEGAAPARPYTPVAHQQATIDELRTRLANTEHERDIRGELLDRVRLATGDAHRMWSEAVEMAEAALRAPGSLRPRDTAGGIARLRALIEEAGGWEAMQEAADSEREPKGCPGCRGDLAGLVDAVCGVCRDNITEAFAVDGAALQARLDATEDALAERTRERDEERRHSAERTAERDLRGALLNRVAAAAIGPGGMWNNAVDAVERKFAPDPRPHAERHAINPAQMERIREAGFVLGDQNKRTWLAVQPEGFMPRVPAVAYVGDGWDLAPAHREAAGYDDNAAGWEDTRVVRACHRRRKRGGRLAFRYESGAHIAAPEVPDAA